jgi:hypothetical protein
MNLFGRRCAAAAGAVVRAGARSVRPLGLPQDDGRADRQNVAFDICRPTSGEIMFHVAFGSPPFGFLVAKKPKQLDGRQQVMRDLAEDAAERGQHFFYVLIHESLGPADRGGKYEDPLNDALGDLGEVTGGGSQLGEGDAIAFCGVDVLVNDRDRGLKVIRQCLRACGAPANTVIEEYVPEFAELRL